MVGSGRWRAAMRRGGMGGLGGAAIAGALPAAAWGAEPVLGSPDYSPPYGSGWGTAAPTGLSNGGVPSGVLTDITWKHWGRKVAHGRASAAIYRPEGNYCPRLR